MRDRVACRCHSGADYDGCMPELPHGLADLPSATWRALSLGDVDALVALHEAVGAADAGEEVMTPELLRRQLGDPHSPAPTNTLALSLPDGSLAGAIVVQERLDAPDARRVALFGTTRPDLRGRGIGTALLAWGVARAEEVLSMQPAGPPGVVEAMVDERRADALALLEAAGFAPARWYLVMRCDLRDPIPPAVLQPGLRIEGYRPGLAEAVRLAHNEAFRDHWGSVPLEADVWQRDFVGDPRFRGDLSFVVWAGEELAGYTVNYLVQTDPAAPGAPEGWIGQLGVRRPWRRQGVASALLARSMRAFRDVGLDGAGLDVDSENPTGAVGVYARLGFRADGRSVRLQRPVGHGRPEGDRRRLPPRRSAP